MNLSTCRRGIVYLSLLIAAAFALPLAAATPAAKPTAATLVKKQPAPKPKSYAAPTAKKVAKSKGAVAERDWTLMYYLDADCNLEPDMLDDMDELESIGSTDNVNILVLLDRTPEHDDRDGNWSNARLLYVTRDATSGKLKSKVLNNLQEMDTANPETLVGFIAFGLQNFPAKHYALILGNHGGTWMGMLNDDTDNQAGMKLAPFVQGLEALKQAGAPKFDVIGFDMCLMAQVEVMDAIAPYASYGVASEELEPGAGYPNHRVLQALAKNPKMSGRDFAQTMVREWGASYAEAGEATVTSSATDLAKVKDLTGAVDALAAALSRADGSVQAAAAQARAATHYYGGEEGGGDLASFDLGEFAARLAQRPEAAPIKAQLDAVQAAVAAAVIEHKEGAAHVGSTGLAIYFPVGKKVDPGYASLPFVRGQWDEFLAKGLAGASGGGAGGGTGAGAAGAAMSVAISSPDPSATHPIGNGLPVTAQVKGRPASIRAAIGYRDADGGCTKVHEEEVASPGAWQDGMTFTYTVRPKVRAISDGKNARMVPTTPLTAGSRYVRADASYNSMRGDQKVTTVFDGKTGKLETIFCESEKGARTTMAVHPVKGEKLVFYQPTVSKDKKTQRFRPVPALVASGGSAKGKAKANGDDLRLVDSGIPAGAYILTLTAYDDAGNPSGGAELNLTAGGGGAGGGAGGPAVAPGLTYPDYGYPAVGYDDLDYVDLTQIIPAGEYDQFEADWIDYNFMAEYQVDDFSAADLAYLEAVALDAEQLAFDREDWSDEFDTYSLEHPGDVDGDGTPDATDLDDDDDGTPDAEDLDDDDDGDLDAEDEDDDNDGTPDDSDTDDDGDGTPDAADLDDDNDGTPDADEDDDEGDDEGDDVDADDSDEDHDGTPDDEDADDDNDGAPDDADADDDNDGTPDSEDTDDDNDGTSDAEESDEDDDGTPDDEDADDDNDGTPDDADADDDNDGTPDDADTDDDNDGTSDEDEGEDDGEDEGEDEAEDEGEDEAEDEGEDEAEDEGEDEAEDEGEDDGGDEAEDDGGDEAEDDGGDEGEE